MHFHQIWNLVNEQTKLELNTGLSEINYIFGTTTPPTTTPPTTTPPTTTPPTTTPEQPIIDISTLSLIGVGITAVIAGVIIMIKRKQTKPSSILQTEVISESKSKH